MEETRIEEEERWTEKDFDEDQRHNRPNVVMRFSGHHDRDGEIWLDTAKCLRCRQIVKCLCVDASEAEYTVVKLCADCIKKSFDTIIVAK